MKIKKTKLKDLLIIETNIYKDNRGFFKEVDKLKISKKKFIFDCFSYSKKNTLRGLHLQRNKPQAKILTVVHGKILDVVVDLRKNSKTYGKHFSIIIEDKSIFLFTFLKILHMVFFACLKIVRFITNVQITEMLKVKLQ